MSKRIVIHLLCSLIGMWTGYTASTLAIPAPAVDLTSLSFKETCEFVHCSCFIEGTFSLLRLCPYEDEDTSI